MRLKRNEELAHGLAKELPLLITCINTMHDRLIKLCNKMIDKTKRYKDTIIEELRDLADSVRDISDRISKLEAKNSIGMARAKIWANAAAHVGSSQCEGKDVPVIWADHILAEYDKRFN